MQLDKLQGTLRRDPLMRRVAGAFALGIMASIFAVGAATAALVGSINLLFVLFP